MNSDETNPFDFYFHGHSTSEQSLANDGITSVLFKK